MRKANRKEKLIHAAVRAAYSVVAKTAGKKGAAASCCLPSAAKPADYSREDIAAVPPGAYLGQGSGAPVRHAGLRPGEVVVDLGSGAGMDSFLAANEVGPGGRVYGFDMTPAMIRRARENASRGGYQNVTFDEAQIESLPLATATADAAISNCVINLSPDKPAVFTEIFRTLKPGGRLSIADIVLRGEADSVRTLRKKATAAGWCACVLGALEEKEYLATIRGAGFKDVHIVAERPAQLQPGGEVRAVAVTVTASKPA
jgi:arsenite methyltransferase